MSMMWPNFSRTVGSLILIFGASPFALASLSGPAGQECQGHHCPATAPSLLAVKAELGHVPFDLTEGNNASNNTNASIEESILKNLEHDFEEATNMPDLDNTTNASGRHGFGQLGANLEFLMLKVAQLETIVELQQVELHSLSEWKRSQTAQTAQAKETEVVGTQKATEVLKKVLHKHSQQREKREFHREKPQGPQKEASRRAQAKEAQARLLQRAKASQRGNATAGDLDAAVSSKIPFVDDAIDFGSGVYTSGTGLIGDALGDAYESATDQVAFVANTVIDSVEMAVDILVRGFSDWTAGCDENRFPSMSVDSHGLDVDWGRQKCWVRLMGQK